jgi:hypothetical protein
MFGGGFLPAPNDMIIRRFLFLFQPGCAPSDIQGWLANYQWDFKLMQKTLQREPMLVSAAVGRPENLIENFGKGSWQNPLGDRADDSSSLVHRLGEGIAWDLGQDGLIYLPPQCQFELTLAGESFQLKSDLDFYVLTHGLRDFPIQ